MSPRIWRFCGTGLEFIHGFFAFVVLFGGKLWMPHYAHNWIIGITVVSQMIYGRCPIFQLADHCFRQYNPNHKSLPSTTVKIYQWFGRIGGGIVVVVLLLVISSGIEMGFDYLKLWWEASKTS